jgi:hypothetical protein
MYCLSATNDVDAAKSLHCDNYGNVLGRQSSMIRQVAPDVGWKKQQAEARMLVQGDLEVFE